ncbi:hypothetical protein THAOC_24423, partial [Thalassiosira oceanica]
MVLFVVSFFDMRGPYELRDPRPEILQQLLLLCNYIFSLVTPSVGFEVNTSRQRQDRSKLIKMTVGDTYDNAAGAGDADAVYAYHRTPRTLAWRPVGSWRR